MSDNFWDTADTESKVAEKTEVAATVAEDSVFTQSDAAFSTEEVYAIAELLRRQKGGAAIVMGSLSPKTRNAQVNLYQSGDVDYLVATDAIGMGINMDLDNVYFSNLKKFDGKKIRKLKISEIGQISGRAGRYLNDGSFGITGDCDEINPEEIEFLENHNFPEIRNIFWRNSNLEFNNKKQLLHTKSIQQLVLLIQS